MSKKLKRAITSTICIFIIIISIISSFFIVKNMQNKAKINNIKEIYTEEIIQEKLDDENIINTDNLMEKIDGNNVIGVIKIDKIGFEGLVYDGTSLDILAKGVGHFENTPYLEGNVCLAAHNTPKYWAKLNTLYTGDKITYTSFLGTKEYYVHSVTIIDETDWSNLKNTKENFLTLITCVKGKTTLRLCVQAIEIN